MGLITYLISFQAGVGPVPWVYNPEVAKVHIYWKNYTSSLLSDLSSLVPKYRGEHVHRLQLVAQPHRHLHLSLSSTGDNSWKKVISTPGSWFLGSIFPNFHFHFSLSPFNRSHLLARHNSNPQGLGFGAYYLFAGMAVLALVWFTLVLPESKVITWKIFAGLKNICRAKKYLQD